ncbi:MAG TPA: toll/interleukin-1 receptor domain-containing protein [Pyrinomonadaceae bacterium]
MSDIFLSYALDDLDDAERLRTPFQQQGWTVWWNPYSLYPDVDIEEADREAKNAKVIVVLWSRSAHKSYLGGMSPYLRGVIKRREQVLLVPVLLDKVSLPPNLDLLKSFDLSDWDGSESHFGLQALLHHLRTLIPASTTPAAPPVSIEGLSLSEMIANAKLAIQKSMGPQFSGIFISYRRNEAAAYAGRLYDRLTARFGKEKVFIDTENVGWGEDFVEAITSAAESCAVMIALISPRWLRGRQGEVDDYVRLEVSKALGRKIRVIPILIQGAVMPVPKELPEDLAPLLRRNALALSDARWERDVEDLIKTLENLLKA